MHWCVWAGGRLLFHRAVYWAPCSSAACYKPKGWFLPPCWPWISTLTCSNTGQLEFMMVNLLLGECTGSFGGGQSTGQESIHSRISAHPLTHPPHFSNSECIVELILRPNQCENQVCWISELLNVSMTGVIVHFSFCEKLPHGDQSYMG